MSFKGQEIPLFDDVLADLIPGFEPEVENGDFSGSEDSLFAELDDMNLLQQEHHKFGKSKSMLQFDQQPEAKMTRTENHTGKMLKKVITLKMNHKNDKELIDFLNGQGMVVKDLKQVKVGNINAAPKVGGGGPCMPSPTPSNSSDPDYDTDKSQSGLSHMARYGAKSMSKHAVLARENRQKKKNYVQGLEKSVSSLQSENKHLKGEMSSMQKCITGLETEVAYLKSIIANQSTLSALLKNIDTTPGIELSASFAPQNITQATKDREPKAKPMRTAVKRSNARLESVSREKENDPESSSQNIIPAKRGKPDHDYASSSSIIPPEMADDDTPAAGVCLHVSNKKVRLEFCAHCSNNAASAQRSTMYNLRGK